MFILYAEVEEEEEEGLATDVVKIIVTFKNRC